MRFGDKVAIYHSGLTPAQRRGEWLRILDGRARIGVGPRSALFLPVARLGVVIVDEEHDGSFKQCETPRYHARDLAIVRAQKAGAVVVLGSATPAVESRHNADAGRYRLLRLTSRIARRQLPQCEIVDLRTTRSIGEGILSEPLYLAIDDALARGEQCIVLLNRRGFSPYVFCRDCGHGFRCSECEVSLTLHRGRNALLCHYCGYELVVPDTCTSCRGFNLHASGLGTERVERELETLFPSLAIARLDRDTAQTRTTLKRTLDRFRCGDAQLLLGTQMVAKGHDFPNVTLVGVLAADSGLHFPDFRAAERTFSLLTQVAGRAGRGDAGGRVLLQTHETEHYAIQSASTQDYEAFLAHELRARRELAYPPFGRLVLLRFESVAEQDAMACAGETAALLRAGPAKVLGPAPAPLSRLKGRYRYQVLLKGSRGSLQETLRALPSHNDPRVRRVVDVDPVDLL
jgi:primosomal protein N' (replication factor Y)